MPCSEERSALFGGDNHFHDCARCGQVVITRQGPPICQTCRRLEAREAESEPMRLFTPAPTQITGQLGF